MAKITRTRVAPAESYDATEDEIPSETQSYDESPAPRQNYASNSASPFQSGWGQQSRKTVKAPFVDFRDRPAMTRVLKLLNDEPEVSYKRHYIPSIRQYRTCPQTPDCPLCLAGLKPSWAFIVNVVEMNDDPNVTKTWTFNWTVAKQLQGMTDKMPLNDARRYFEVKQLPEVGVQVLPIRSNEVQEDHNMLPLGEAEIEEREQDMHGDEVVFLNTTAQLQEVANALTPGDIPKPQAKK